MGETRREQKGVIGQQTDNAPHLEENLLHMLTSNAPVGVYLLDKNASCQYVNQTWCEMTGMTPEEALRNGWLRAIHPDDRERAHGQWKQLSITEWGWQQEYRFQALNGKITWIAGYTTKLRDERGSVSGYFGINIDVSSTKNIETALRASEERYRTTIDAMSDGIHVVDKNLVITLNNSTIARWAQEMGLSGILVGKTPFKVFPFLPEQVEDEYRRVFQTGKMLVTEEKSRFAHKLMHTETRKVPIVENGRVAHVATVIRDISKRAEAEQALRESEEKYRLLFENMAQGVFYQQADGKLIDVNSSALEMLGVTRDQFLGRTSFHPAWKVVLPDGTFLPAEQHPSMVALSTGKRIDDFELGVYHPKTDDYAWLVVNAIPQFREGEEKPYQVFVTLHDITERKRNNEKVQRQAQELKALQETVLDIIAPYDLSTLLPTIVERAVRLLGASEGGLYLNDTAREEVRCVVSYNTKRDYTGTVLKYGEGAAGTVAKTGEALIIDDYRTWPGRAAVFEDEQPFVSILSVPLKWQDRVIGVLHIEGKPFSQADQELLGMFAAHAAMAVGKSQALEQAQKEISERKQAENALRKSELKLKEAEKVAHFGYYEIDIQSGEARWSDETFRIFGMDPDTATEPTIQEYANYLHPDDVVKVFTNFDKAINEKKVFDLDYRIITLNKQTKYIHSVGHISNDTTEASSKMFGVFHDITERKRIEEALHKSEASLKKAEKIAKLGYWEWDILTNELTWSEETFHLYGMDPVYDKPTYEVVLETVTPEYREQFAAAVEDAVQKGKHFEGEYQLIGRDGKLRYTHTTGEVIRDSNGHPLKMFGVVQDITERKQAKLALENSEELHRNILTSISDAVYITDENGIFTFICANTDVIFGYTYQEVEKMEKIHKLLGEEIVAYENVVEQGEITNIEHEIVDKSGFRHNLLINVKKVDIENGKMLFTCHDITERRQAEIALQESQKNLQAILDANTDSALLIELDGQIVFCNEIVANRFGKKKENLIGTNTYDLVDISVAEQRRKYAEWVIANDQAVRFVDERYGRTIDNSIYPIFDESGQVVRLAIYGQDITEQRRIFQDLQDSEHNLQTIFDTMTEGIALNEIVYDENGEMVDYRVLKVNPAFYTTADYSGTEVEGNLATQLYGMSNEFIKAFWKEHLEKNATAHAEMWSPLNNKCFYISTSPFVNDKFVTSFLDITKRKKVEDSLRTNKEYIESLNNSLADVIFTIDLPSREIEYVNNAVEKVFRYRAEECFGQKTILFYPNEKEFLEFGQRLKDTIKHGTEILHTEQLLKRKNGELFWAEITTTFLQDEEMPAKAISIIHDISERKQIETNLETALKEARLRQKETTALLEAAQSIPLCKTFEEAARNIFDICKELLGAKSGYVALLSEDGAENEVLFLDAGGLPCDVDPELPMPIRGLREVAYKTNAVAYDNKFMDSPWMEYMPQGHVALENVLFTPLNIQNKTVGLIGLANKPGGFTERDANIAKTFGDLAAVGFRFTRNQDELRESEERYRLLAENSTDGIALYGADYVPIYVSPSSARMVGYRYDNIKNVNVFDFIHPDDKERVLKLIRQATKQEKKVLKNEFRVKRKDGDYIWVEAFSNRTLDKEGNVTQFIVNIRDVTERKLAEQENKNLLAEITQQREELRTLNARVVEADETERRRIAKDLHDQIGQNLSALNINMNIIQGQIPADAKEIKKRIDASLELVDETTDEIRKVMEDLHPTVLDDYGLLSALEWLSERVSQNTGLHIEVKSQNLKEKRLDHRIEVNLFRITQEALNNAARHAEASNVKVELKQLKKLLRLSIVDNGSGFDVTTQRGLDDRGWGLRIMRERAESIGGRLKVESYAGKGTNVIVELSNS